jgi:hypothetical protein
MDYDQYRPATSEKNTGTHICGASPIILAPCITSGKLMPVGKIGTSRAKQWWALQEPHICEFKTWIMINIDQQQLGKYWYPYMWCFSSHFGSMHHQWQIKNRGH